MIKKFLTVSWWICVSGVSVIAQSSLDDLNIIFKNDFENSTVGVYSRDEWYRDWNKPYYDQRLDKTDIVQDFSDTDNPTKVVQYNFPAGSLGPSEGGGQWRTKFANQDELYISYDIMFMPGFQYALGGKIPGAIGGELPDFMRPSGYNGFTGGLMFKGDHRLVFYMYYPDQSFEEGGTSFTWGGVNYPKGYFLPSSVEVNYGSGEACYMHPGEWHNITYRMVMNTLQSEGHGNYDGIIEAYFDGKLVTQLSKLLFRQTSQLAIDCMKMVTFFGGGTDEWRNPIDEWIRMDNVILYTFKNDVNVPRGNTLSSTDRTINYWRQFSSIPTTVPDAPISLTSTAQTKSSISLRWQDRSINEKGFKIFRSTSPEGGFVEIASLTANVNNFTDNSLKPGTNYFYKVLAYNDIGNSNETSVLRIATLPIILPADPAGLTVSQLSYTKVILTWNDRSSNETNFELERLGPNNPNIINTFKLNANTTTFSDEGLQMNVTYTYRIRAYNNDGYSAYSNTVQVITPYLALPAAPSMLKSKEFTEKSITIRWNDNSNNESGFIITRLEGNNPANPVTIRMNANDTVLTDQNLLPNTTYIYTVKAVNEAGNSPLSNKDVASTLSLAETKRVKDGLIAYYNFGYDPDYIIHDLSEYGEPLNLKIQKSSAVSWNENNRLEVLSNTALVSTTPAEKITSALRKTGELSLECWIRPAEPNILSSCRVVSMGISDSEVGFVLDQNFSDVNDEKLLNYSMRVQTESTNKSGYPEITPFKDIAFLNMQHVVYVRDTLGEESMYINGQKTASGFRPNSFDTWSKGFYLKLGNENDMNHPWRGTFYALAVYNKSLTPTQIRQNYNLGPCDSISSDNLDFEISLFPNPVSDILHVSIMPVEFRDMISRTTVRLLDVYGKIYYEEVVFNPNIQTTKDIDVSGLSSGIYLLQVLSGSYHKSVKFIVQ